MLTTENRLSNSEQIEAFSTRPLLKSTNYNNTTSSSDSNNLLEDSNIKQSLLNTPSAQEAFLNSALESNSSFQVISSGSCSALIESDSSYPSNHLLSSPHTTTTEMNLLDNVNNQDRQPPYQSNLLKTSNSSPNESLSSFPLSKPCLHFVNGAQQHHPVVFECREGWRVNDPKTKHPHSTTHNCSIKDYLVIEGNDFENCKSFLKLKDSAGGKVVTEAFFTFDPKTRKHVVEFQVVSKINNMKGNTSSRVAYIDIYDSNNKLICVSDSFWVRSRSRGQMMLDMAKRRKEPTSSKQSEIVHQAHSTTSSNDSPSEEGEQETALSNVIEDEVAAALITKQKPIIQSPLSSTNQSSSDPLSSLANVASSIVPLGKERLPSFADLTLSSPPIAQESSTSPMKEASLPHIDCITSDLPYRKRKISEDSRIRSLTLQIEKNSADISKLYQLVEEQNKMISDLSQTIVQLCKKQKQQ